MKWYHLRADAMVERIRTNSVLNPLLWLCVTDLLTVPACYWSSGTAQLFFGFLAATPIVGSLLAYGFFAIKDPDRIQSEDYRLAREQLMQASKEQQQIPLTSNQTGHPAPPISEAEASTPDQPPPITLPSPDRE